MDGLSMAIKKIERASSHTENTDWSLSGEQMLYFMQHNNMIVAALEADNLASIREFAASEGFISRFGSMGFDEAYDRYLTAVEQGRA